MVTWSIGAVNIYASEDQDPSEFLRVIADEPDSRITAVIDTGDHASFVMACSEIARLDSDSELPTPIRVASYVGGGGASLCEVMPDGTLRGWRDDDDLELTLDNEIDDDDLELTLDEIDDGEPDQPRISDVVGTRLKVTNWVTGETVFEGNPDAASGLTDGAYAGESDKFYGTVFVTGGKIDAVSS